MISAPDFAACTLELRLVLVPLTDVSFISSVDSASSASASPDFVSYFSNDHDSIAANNSQSIVVCST